MHEDELQQQLETIEFNLRGRAIDKQLAGLNELAKIESNLAVPLLERLLDSPDFMQRRIAVMGLGNHQIESSFQLLARIINEDADANVVGEAANSIFDFGERAIPLLVDLFRRQPNWLVRQTIIPLLLETTAYADILTTAELAIADDTQSVKEVGILALGHLLTTPLSDQSLAHLTLLCSDPYWRNRWRATIALQSLCTAATQALILQMQQDEHFRVVAAALEIARHWSEKKVD
jgi:HEAT repeat protein